PSRAQVIDHVEERASHGYLGEILLVEARRDRTAELELPRSKGMLAEKRLQQRGLSRSIRADEAERVPAHHRTGELLDEHTVADAHGGIDRGYDAIAAAFGDVEANRHRVFVAH